MAVICKNVVPSQIKIVACEQVLREESAKIIGRIEA